MNNPFFLLNAKSVIGLINLETFSFLLAQIRVTKYSVLSFQTGTLTTKPTANIQGTATLQGTLVKGPTGSSIVVKTPGNVSGHFTAINKRLTAHSGGPAASLATMVSAYLFIGLISMFSES